MRLVLAVLLLIALPLAADQADLGAALSIQNDRTPYFGAAVNLQLTVTNNGPDRASGIVARWTVPYSGISYQIDRCTKQGENVLFCTAGDLAPGASTTFLAGAYIPADTRTMVASVSSSADDPNPANNDASLEIVPVVTPYPQPVLTVLPPPAEGRPSAYGLTIENRGGGTANDVHVRWTFEGDLELGGADCKTIDAATLDCVVPSVAAHQTSGALHVFVTPGSAGGRIASRAVATFAGGETDPGPLSAAIENVIAPNPVLKVSIAPPTELDGNGNLTFRYTVSNVSSADATRLVGRMSFPSGSTFVGASGADCRETTLPPYNELEMTCTMPDLRAGQSLVAAIAVRPPAPQGRFQSTLHLAWGDPVFGFQAFVAAGTIIYHDIFVTTSDDGGAGSLRAAIEETNAQCTEYAFPCRILFRVAGTIEPLSPLPTFTVPEAAIDGGGKVTLRGTRTFADGLVFRGFVATVTGLTIDGFARNGIVVASSAVSTIAGNTITGSGLRAIAVEQGRLNVTGNVLARNARSGIFMTGGSGTIQNNSIADNGASGIYIGPHAGNLEIAGNTIAGNRDFGVAIDAAAHAAVVRVNSIHDNGIDAIDIGLDGPNDRRAPHRPLITSARFDPASGDTIITAALDKPADLIRHETLFFFANAALDASGRAEAETFIESAPVRGQAAELRVHADLRGKYIAAFDSAFFDYFGEATWSEVSELSDGVQVF